MGYYLNWFSGSQFTVTTTDTIAVITASVNTIIFVSSAVIAWRVYRWNDEQKKKDRALALFTSLMAGEFLVKARLVSQEFLLEHPDNGNFRALRGANFEELDARLRSGTPSEREARFYIRAIPNFFQTVNLAWKHGYLLEDEQIFSEVYAWCWVNIIEERCARIRDNEMFSEHKWMRREADVDKAREERRERISMPPP